MAPRKVLMLTNSEFGEANTVLAVCHALVTGAEDVEVHVASFAQLRKEIERTNVQALYDAPQSRPIIFHEIPGVPLGRAAVTSLGLPPDTVLPPVMREPPTLFTTPRVLAVVLHVLSAWEVPAYVDMHRHLLRIISQVGADIVGVNTLFGPGLTACTVTGVKYIMLCPLSVKDVAASSQPNGRMLWKYPCACSGLPYPVPLLYIPLNIFYTLCFVALFLFDRRRKQIDAYFQKHTGDKITNFINVILQPEMFANIKILVNIPRELDYDISVMPENIIEVGPLIRAASPVEEADPELAKWLAQGPTVYINLGTLVDVPEESALEMAGALRSVLDAASSTKALPNLQVLWKLRKRGTYDTDTPKSRMADVLGQEMQNGRLRIVNWVEAEPISILQSGHLVCFVNHGGANSFAEGVAAGVPQVVLPAWSDCYDSANRAEYLGIGQWGSRKACPQWTSKELGAALHEVMLGAKAGKFQAKATALAETIRRKGAGRQLAAKYFLEEIE